MKYEAPICEILKFSAEDIITTSPSNGSETKVQDGSGWLNSLGQDLGL